MIRVPRVCIDACLIEFNELREDLTPFYYVLNSLTRIKHAFLLGI